MKALVTGCAGFIGSHLSEALLDRGWTVVGIDNFLRSSAVEPRWEAANRLALHPNFRFEPGDVADLDLRAILSDIDVVFHLAARAGVRTSWHELDDYLRSNLLATQRLLDAVSHVGKAKIIFASSSSVYGRAVNFPTRETDRTQPISPYGVTKLACEHLLSTYMSEFDVDAVALRYFTVYGPRQRSDMAFHLWIRAALTGSPITIFGDGGAIRDFTFVGDVVEATIEATALPTGTVANVAGGVPVDLNQVLDLLSSLSDVPLDIRREATKKGDPSRTGGNTELLRRLIGWKPSVSLAEGLSCQVDWMRTYLAKYPH